MANLRRFHPYEVWRLRGWVYRGSYRTRALATKRLREGEIVIKRTGSFMQPALELVDARAA